MGGLWSGLCGLGGSSIILFLVRSHFSVLWACIGLVVVVVLVGGMFALVLFLFILEVVCVTVFPIAFVIHHMESVAPIRAVMIVQGILGCFRVCNVLGFCLVSLDVCFLCFFLCSCPFLSFSFVVVFRRGMLRVWLVVCLVAWLRL